MNKVKLDIPAGQPPRGRVSWIRWEPRERRETYNFDITKKVAESTPGNADLRRWAAQPQNHPESSWYDDDGADPFSPKTSGT